MIGQCLGGSYFVFVINVGSFIQNAVGRLDVTFHGSKMESCVAQIVGEVHGLLHFSQEGYTAVMTTLNSLKHTRERMCGTRCKSFAH